MVINFSKGPNVHLADHMSGNPRDHGFPGDFGGNAHRGTMLLTFVAKFWRIIPQQNNLSWN